MVLIIVIFFFNLIRFLNIRSILLCFAYMYMFCFLFGSSSLPLSFTFFVSHSSHFFPLNILFFYVTFTRYIQSYQACKYIGTDFIRVSLFKMLIKLSHIFYIILHLPSYILETFSIWNLLELTFCLLLQE